jgi:uncharacterized coiled-coil protein SlyX
MNFHNKFGVRPFVLFDADDGSGSGDTPGVKTLSQDEVNKLVGDARKSARETATKDLFKTLGVESADDLQALIKAARDAEAKGKTEIETLQNQVKDLTKKLKDATDTASASESALKSRILANEIKALAMKDVLDKEGKTVTRKAFRQDALDDVILLIDKTIIEEGDAGEYKNIEKALGELAKTRPYLLAEETKPASKGTPRTGERQTPKQPTTQVRPSQSYRL